MPAIAIANPPPQSLQNHQPPPTTASPRSDFPLLVSRACFSPFRVVMAAAHGAPAGAPVRLSRSTNLCAVATLLNTLRHQLHPLAIFLTAVAQGSSKKGCKILQNLLYIRLSCRQFPKHTFPPQQSLHSWKSAPSLRRSLRFGGRVW